MKLKQKNVNKLSTKLINFLPFLKAGVDELYEEVENISKENPFLEVKNKKFITFGNLKNAITDKIEALTVSKKTFFEELTEQIETSNLFPTAVSKKIAWKIVENINSQGYFEGDEEEIAKEIGCRKEKVSSVRERFMYLNPAGVGAKDLKECFLFQLYNMDYLDEKLFSLVKKMVLNLERLEEFTQEKDYKEALNIIKNFKINPAEEFGAVEEIIPEIIIYKEDGDLKIKINDEFYPEISIKESGDDKYSKEKFKEARSVVDALEMRKATLKKIALMIVELQYDFFKGGVIKPMKIKDLAQELDFASSTISRAISNKYLLCDRGIISLKSFFSTALDEEISANQIKEEIKEIIKKESKTKPLSDDKICAIVNDKYNLNLVRRTITKYREALRIPSSRERKKIYNLGGEVV
ncbi:MAG: RNA polymerase factor sigma-54 [Nautiliaceae bacterium]